MPGKPELPSAPPASGEREDREVLTPSEERGDREVLPPPEVGEDREILTPPVVAVVAAPWALPSVPAPQLLRELQRRWGGSLRALVLDAADDVLLERFDVTALPTWIRLEPAESARLRTGEEIEADGRRESAADPWTTQDAMGNRVELSGTWRVVARIEGALAKFQVEEQLGAGFRAAAGDVHTDAQG